MRAGDLEHVKKYESGILDIRHVKLTSLKGCPKEVTGDFFCNYNKLTTLKDGPKKVTETFSCGNNKLSSLKYGPENVYDDFDCQNNRITSFEHFPRYIGNRCTISNNKFESFKGIDQHIEFMSIDLFARGMKITSGFSDLFGVDGLQYVWIDNRTIEKIVNRYLPSKDLIEFQDEMIKAGYESYL